MKISVIVPTYNSGVTIKKCIKSVLSQMGAELELIVVNDGSSDNTADIVSDFGSDVKLINKTNGGVADARNTGLKEASGDYVMFLDADDYLADGCIQSLVLKQAEYNADIIRFEYMLAYKNGVKELPRKRFEKEEFVKKDDFKQKIYPLYTDSIMLNSVCMTLYKREIVQNVRFRTNMKTAEDAVFSVQAYTNANNVLIFPEPFYIYNRMDGSITGNGISVLTKYKCNIILSGVIIRHLSQWKMNTPYWVLKTLFRPLVLTFDKALRMVLSKKNS